MPELVPLWERLVDLAGGGDDVARMLSLYRPTAYLSGCTQAVRPGPDPLLVRNYDYHPYTFEATFVRTGWLGTSVLASSDCLWGVLDGVNEHGLAVALSFGGSPLVGDGFGIPLILRYVLQSCATVAQARKVLRRVPSHMAYNVSMVDRGGAYAVAYLRPGTETVIIRERVATNHQRGVEWPAYAERTKTTERKEFVRTRLRRARTGTAIVRMFLEPPLFVTEYEQSHGTLYTILYRPNERAVDVHWLDGAVVHQSLDHFSEREFVVPIPMAETTASHQDGRPSLQDAP